VRAGVGGDANNRTGACIEVDGLGLGLELDWTRRRCVTPGEKLKDWKRRVAKPSDCLYCTNARRLLLEDVDLPRDEGRIDARTLTRFSSCWRRQCNAMRCDADGGSESSVGQG
jgi:hypothetical protein